MVNQWINAMNYLIEFTGKWLKLKVYHANGLKPFVSRNGGNFTCLAKKEQTEQTVDVLAEYQQSGMVE